ncbi:MAG: hypothetical protein Q9165_003822 [Trypethelium subeluteriae]
MRLGPSRPFRAYDLHFLGCPDAGTATFATETGIATAKDTVIETVIEIVTPTMIVTAVAVQDLQVEVVALDVTTKVIPTLPAETIGSESAKIGTETGVAVTGSGTEIAETVTVAKLVGTMTVHRVATVISWTRTDIEVVGIVMDWEEEQEEVRQQQEEEQEEEEACKEERKWDIKPPGYEHVSAESAKMSGMFALPGGPQRPAPVDPSRLQALNQPSGQASNNALKPSSARQSKRLFVYNFPASATNDSIQEYFNLELNGLNVVSGIDTCLSAQLSKDGSFALLEFKAPEDATMALALDGTSMEDNGMAPSNGAANGDHLGLAIKRPKDYIMPAVADDVDMEDGAVSGSVPDTQNKLCISQIPDYLTEDQVQELLAAFGELKSFVLARYTSTEQSKGVAFCEYKDPSSTVVALDGLNGMELGGQFLKVTRASLGIQQASGVEMGVNAMSMLAGTTSADSTSDSRVLQLLNITTAEELMKDGEYDGVMDDIEEEASKYGKVLDIKIPRPVGGREVPGVGKVFIKFEDSAAAQKALRAMAGRNFSNRTVVATYFGEEYFDINAW